MVRFSNQLVAEAIQPFWAALQAGAFLTDAAAVAGTHRARARGWVREAGGVRPRRGRDLKGRCLSFAEREEIALGRAGGESIRVIAGRLGRSPSTVSRELSRNACVAGRYRATTAHALAYERASRPKPAKLAVNVALRARTWRTICASATRRSRSPAGCAASSPSSGRCGCRPRRSTQSLYVQSRGALRRDLARCLRTGRALRRPCRQPGQRKNRIPDMINIAERPGEAGDRAVPGHWEGDLIIGKRNLTAIGTLVERTTGYTMLVHLPDGYKPEQVRDALAEKIQTLPEALRASLTWDQGPEMRDWKSVSVAADIDIYFCDPHAPWQRATNENTNGLLRQYFPKGSDLAVHSAADLDWVASELNDRPRKRLAFAKPIEEIGPLLLQ